MCFLVKVHYFCELSGVRHYNFSLMFSDLFQRNMEKGLVFDIQRFAMHDGPGIRTCVFLKGCPLTCLWCHNIESQRFEPQLSYDATRCIHCGRCMQVCPSGAHRLSEGVHVFLREKCRVSGNCVEVCPSAALRMIGRMMSVEEVMEEVRRDKVYYDSSGGGITISGGEPMSRLSFTRALLQQAHREGIHTCLDTCGYAPVEKYVGIMPWVDVFLFDYKATGEEKHKALTGKGQARILESLYALARHRKPIILRCPIVAGLNDESSHFEAIARLSNELESLLYVEIMPYHDFGLHKAEKVGMDNRFSAQTANDEQKQEWIRHLQVAGCRNLRV